MEINATLSLSNHTLVSSGDHSTVEPTNGIITTETLAVDSLQLSASYFTINGARDTGSISSTLADGFSSSILPSESQTYYPASKNVESSFLFSSTDFTLQSSFDGNTYRTDTFLGSTVTNIVEETISSEQRLTSESLFTDISKVVTLDPTEQLLTSTINAGNSIETDFIDFTPSLSYDKVTEITSTTPGEFSTSSVSFSDASVKYNDDWPMDDVFYNSNSTRHLDNTLFTSYEEYSDDITIVIGIFVPLVIVALLVAAFVCYAKYWKKTGNKRKSAGRAKVSFNDNPIVTGSVLAPRYSDAEGCTANVFADLPDKSDGFVSIDLTDESKVSTNGGLKVTRKNSGQKLDPSNLNLESICEKEELFMSEDELHEETKVNSASDANTENDDKKLKFENADTDKIDTTNISNENNLSKHDGVSVPDEIVHYDNNINVLSGQNKESNKESSKENSVSVNNICDMNGEEEITKL